MKIPPLYLVVSDACDKPLIPRADIKTDEARAERLARSRRKGRYLGASDWRVVTIAPVDHSG